MISDAAGLRIIFNSLKNYINTKIIISMNRLKRFRDISQSHKKRNKILKTMSHIMRVFSNCRRKMGTLLSLNIQTLIAHGIIFVRKLFLWKQNVYDSTTLNPKEKLVIQKWSVYFKKSIFASSYHLAKCYYLPFLLFNWSCFTKCYVSNQFRWSYV